MARLTKRYLFLLFLSYLVIAFICMDINPIQWHWVGRLIFVVLFIAGTVFTDFLENLSGKK